MMALANVTAARPYLGAERANCDLSFETVTTRAGFDALEADWNALFVRAGRSTQVFQSFNWNWHWAQHFLSDPRGRTTFAIVTGRRAGQLVIVWPLVMERMSGLRSLAWLGEPVSQYGDVLMEESAASLDQLLASWAYVVTTLKPDLARLNKTRSDSVVAPLLRELGAISTQQLEAPFLDLASAPTFSAYEERYSAKDRKNRKRLARRLEDLGNVAYLTLSEGPKAAGIARAAIDIKRVWLKEKGLVSPALADARTLAFFAAVAADTVRPTHIRVATVMCGDTIAAVEIAFACRDRLAIHIMAYDRAFEKAAAGILLLERMIATSLEQGVKVYDLLAPGDGYKKEWADGAVRVDDFAVPLTMTGRIFAHGFLAFARPRLKAAVARIPLSTRRLLSARLSRAVLVLGGV
jgi:CelD/BcsL family acetyltransferase involved in cellulose biosynthesis